eukprot:Polyplicarium_translucidae@DN1368_c0_g1_i1.p3
MALRIRWIDQESAYSHEQRSWRREFWSECRLVCWSRPVAAEDGGPPGGRAGPLGRVARWSRSAHGAATAEERPDQVSSESPNERAADRLRGTVSQKAVP